MNEISMKNFARDLIEMESEEATLRESLLEAGALKSGYQPELRHLHEVQVARVQDQVKSLGWPSIKAVGEDAYDALFMIALNAISRPDFMRAALKAFGGAKDAMSRGYAAYLEDRIAYFERRPQTYGTQWDVTVEGETVLWPVMTPQEMNLRRAKAGLDTFEELDFSILELNLGQGLKRAMGQYDFLYEVGWLTPICPSLVRLLKALGPYTSGGLLGPAYAQAHYEGTLGAYDKAIDIVMPLQHKEAFEAFLKEEGHTIVAKGLKRGTYALKDDAGYFEIVVNYLAFTESEAGWVVEGLGATIMDLQVHTANGWLMSESSLQIGRSLNWL